MERGIQWQPANAAHEPYERPGRTWICGHHADGRPCRTGPDARGQCVARAECDPVKRGDRWECTRPAHAGGRCPEGPRPDGACAHPIERCTPVRSFHARKTLIARWTLVAAVGLLAAGLSTTWRRSFVMPGGLAAGHAMLSSAADGGCANCHTNVAGSMMVTRTSDTQADPVSAKCLACHTSQVRGTFALRAHSAAPDRLAVVTDRINQEEWSQTRPARIAIATFFSPPPHPAENIACVTCHREHRGPEHKLATMSDIECQRCHAGAFVSFASGHPEFGGHAPTGPVAFNHATHQFTHFGQAPFACTTCHRDDASGRRMLAASFEATCAGCHDQNSADLHGDQIRKVNVVALQLPEMDGAAPLPWPREAGAGEALTPLIRLLIAGDVPGPGLDAAMSLTADEDAGGVPFEWQASDDERLALAQSIERVIREIASGDTEAQRSRLARVLEAAPDEGGITRVVEQLASAKPAATQAGGRWFDARAANAVTGAGSVAAPGWLLNADGTAVVYRAAAHADPFLRAVAEMLAAHADGSPADRDATDAAGFRRNTRTSVFRDLTSSQSGGALYAACLRCHAVEPAGRAFRVRWRSEDRTVPHSGLTDFDHRSHVPATGPQDCSTCHIVERAVEAPQNAAGSGLARFQKAQCIACHSAGRAPATCLTCHRYHALAQR